jgi:hypothetical protein
MSKIKKYYFNTLLKKKKPPQKANSTALKNISKDAHQLWSCYRRRRESSQEKAKGIRSRNSE